MFRWALTSMLMGVLFLLGSVTTWADEPVISTVPYGAGTTCQATVMPVQWVGRRSYYASPYYSYSPHYYPNYGYSTYYSPYYGGYSSYYPGYSYYYPGYSYYPRYNYYYPGGLAYRRGYVY
jgi:hypothetical protein